MALRAYSRARSTASRGVATGTNSLASTPALSIGHVRRPNTVLPRSKAWAISLNVPLEPFTAMMASAVRTMIRFRAVLIAVAIGKSMWGFASALFPVGRTPTVRPPPRFAPFADASMTPFRPPQIRTASARATRNPTSSARASPSGDAVLPPPITPMINFRAMRESPFKLATELSLCRCQSTFDTFAPDVDGMMSHLVEKSERMLVGRRPLCRCLRCRARGPYKYGVLTEDLLDVEVSVRVGKERAVGALRYVPELDYSLMYLKAIGGPTKD